jgi:hypothetical protein
LIVDDEVLHIWKIIDVLWVEVILVTFGAEECWLVKHHSFIYRNCITIDLGWPLTIFLTCLALSTCLTRSFAWHTLTLRTWTKIKFELELTIIALSLTFPVFSEEVANVASTRSATEPIIWLGWTIFECIQIGLTCACGTWVVAFGASVVRHLLINCILSK